MRSAMVVRIEFATARRDDFAPDAFAAARRAFEAALRVRDLWDTSFMIRGRSWLLWGAVAIAAAAAGAWLARQIDRPAPVLASGTWLPQPRPVGEFMLTDQD